MTGIATGGFTVTDDSFAGYGTGTQLVALVVITVGAVSFVAHHLLVVERDLRAWWRFTPTRAQIVWWAVGLAGWGPLLLPVLIIAMVVGAPSGSTGGGLKLDRPVWLLKDVLSRVRGTPRDPAPLTWDGGPVEPEARHRSVRHAGEMLGLWLLTLAVGTVALSWSSGVRDWTVLFDAASALSNVGLDPGVVDGDLRPAGKLLVTGLMYLGRLELLAALVLASQREHIDER